MDPAVLTVAGEHGVASAGYIGTVISATAALGTASVGLVDASKAFKAGVSNVGYGFIAKAVEPFELTLKDADLDLTATVYANWIAGGTKDDQKAAARNIIRLGLTSQTAPALAQSLGTIDGARLQAAARKIESGEALEDADVTLLARFDSIIDARLDTAYERATQKYKNAARVSAAGVSFALALCGWWTLQGTENAPGLLTAMLVGLIAVPIAPVAKDLISGISTAVEAFRAVRR